MQNSFDIYKVKQNSFLNRFKKRIFRLLKLNNDPIIKLYNGYGNGQTFVVFGHVLILSSLPRKTYRHNYITNFFSMLRTFMVKPLEGAALQLEWEGVIYDFLTDRDGFFRFEWKIANPSMPGRYRVTVYFVDNNNDVITYAKGLLFVPDKHKYAIISDIDDTFLISHTANIKRRLYVLLTKNAHSRKAFDGVVNHYKMLANAGMKTGATNPFFYVSSSEWNLYDFLVEFSKQVGLPEGVFLLSQLKQFSQLLATGQNNHSGKFVRIIRIAEAFPHQQLILFGDDSQKDPEIYLLLVEHFPGKIKSVYIRKRHKKNYEAVKKITGEIEKNGVPCCYFEHSAEAIMHSKKIGLIALVTEDPFC